MHFHTSDSLKTLHAARVSELAEDYALARRDAKRINAAAAKIANFVRQQANNLTSGLNQGNRGSLAPSA